MRRITKLSEQPFCRSCGKPIGKCTSSIFVRKEPGQYDHPHPFTGYVYVGDAWPMATDDCRKLTSQEVVGIRRHNDGRVSHFYAWDGESYVDAYFCSNGCAIVLAVAAAKAGHHLKPWRDVISAIKIETMKHEAREATS